MNIEMNVVEIIEKKIANKPLTNQEIKWVFESYLNQQIPDYQMSALLMAILFNGMSDQELFTYTEVLINSGKTIEYNDLDRRIDKHSTGGVGDKISLIISPILAALNVKVGKISGRGLGFTGGTIDKLESIPNIELELPLKTFVDLSQKEGIALISATDEFAPLDKILYALRDVTGTVSSLALIAASVMSKKLVANTKYLFIDLKCGNSAFLKNQDQAQELADILKRIATHFEREISIMISDMEQPLGNYVGNSLEVWEAIHILRDDLQNDAYVLAKEICTQVIAKIDKIDLNAAAKKVDQVITSKKAYKMFQKWIGNQKGNLKAFLEEDEFATKFQYVIKTPKSGYVSFKDSVNFGYGLIELGGGRKQKTDVVDSKVGFNILKKTNDRVEEYDELVSIYSNKELSEEFLQKIADIFVISEQPTDYKQVITTIAW